MGNETSKRKKRVPQGTSSNPTDSTTLQSDTELMRISSEQGQETNQQRRHRHHQHSQSDDFSLPSSSSHRQNHDHHSHSHHPRHHHHHHHYPTLSHHDHLHQRRIVINRWSTMDPEAMDKAKPKSFYDEYIKP